jgi:catechol 2,3-dioxygenase-like lactoylglutathione lyase family enzyme
MKVTAIVPNLQVASAADARDFYTGFLGLGQGFDYNGVLNLRSPDNPLAQVQLIEGWPDMPAVSIHVSDADEAYAEATSRGYEIVYPLTHEPDGRVRFYVRAPDGTLVNIIQHDDSEHLPHT